MKKSISISFSLVICLSLMLFGCNESGLERVKKSTTPYENGKISLEKAFADWGACKSLGWFSFEINNREIVEYSCEQLNSEEFIGKVIENVTSMNNPRLISKPSSVISKFQWEAGNDEINLLYSANIWSFLDRDGNKKSSEEDRTTDGVAVATSSAELFDMSYFGSKSRNERVANMFGPQLVEHEIQAYIKKESGFLIKKLSPE